MKNNITNLSIQEITTVAGAKHDIQEILTDAEGLLDCVTATVAIDGTTTLLQYVCPPINPYCAAAIAAYNIVKFTWYLDANLN